MKSKKIKWNIFIYFLAFTGFLLGLLWIFQTVFLSDMYKFVRKREINSTIVQVEENINNPKLDQILSEIELNKEIIVRPTNEFQRPGQRRMNRRHEESITKEQEFKLENGKIISLTFHALITPVDATVSTLKRQLLIVSIIMIAFSIIMASIISKRISKPIENINESAKKLAMGNYEVDFTGEGYLEVRELSNTLNIATKELSKVDGLRRELMANISHDLRTPLALIYSYAEIMHDFPEEITSEQSQIIMDETRRLTYLVNDILDISNFETGSYKLSQSRFNLTEVLEETINRTEEFIKTTGYSLKFVYTNQIYVYADKVKITQAFYNLLTNAINHTDDDKIVWIKQIVEDDMVKIQVIDNGEGIEKKDLPKIWERYYKLNSTHNRALIGTGLGLSIVREIIDLHGGKYGVESKLGKGSIFWFSLMREK